MSETHLTRRTLVLGAVVGGLAGCASDEPVPPATTPAPWPPTEGSPGDPTDGTTTSAAPPSSSEGGLVTVSLPTPDELQPRWAAYAAAFVGAQFATVGGPSANGGDWVYEEDFGGWGRMTRFKDGRAVFVGSATIEDVRADKAAESAARQEMLAGAPSWWAKGLNDALPARAAVHFVCGFDKGKWRRVSGTGGTSGIDALSFPLRSEDELVEHLVLMGTSGRPRSWRLARAAARSVIKAGDKVTVDQLRRLGPEVKDARAGVIAARAFAARGRH